VFSCLALLALILLAGCNKPGAGDSNANNAGSNNPTASPSPSPSDATGGGPSGNGSNVSAGSTPAEAQATPRPPLVIPAGKVIQIRLSQALGSKESQAGQSFSGSVAESVEVNGQRVIERGAGVHGTVVDAKAMGHFAGGALLQLRLDSVTIHGERRAVETNLWSQTLKGKGKRSAVAIGGGAGLGAALGGIFGGGKGAAIGAAAGAGAGTAGAAYTGNKEIQLPAESTLQFKLKRSIQVQ
jgi:hypothetical protein